MNTHAPIVSEFDTPEQADAYAAWLKGKVAASLADQRPTVPDDEARIRARAILAARRR